MSLITCKVCGKRISDYAKNCPSCGHFVMDNTLPNLMKECMGAGGFDIEKDKKMINVGYAFEKGQTVNIDLVSAAFWYEKVAKNNSAANDFVNNVRSQLTSNSMKKIATLKSGKTVYIGDEISIGKYPYTSSGQLSDLKWIILDINGDKAFLITKDCIDHKVFNDAPKNTPVNWETSSLRKWLNDDFIHSSFDQNEQLCIEDTNVVTMIDLFKDYKYVNTTDKIFILSERETSGYCYTENTRFGKATEYAKGQGADYDILEGRGWWWLRDSNDMSFCGFGSGISCVWFKGKIALDNPENEDASIRPAMWINLSKYDR